MTSGVYRIEIGENFYYGSSKDVDARRRQHLSSLNKGTHYNARLQRAWNKYGGEWVFEVVDICDLSMILEVEQMYLTEFFGHERCMNLVAVAGSPLGYRHTPETIAKMRRPKSPEQVAKQIGNRWGTANKGRKATPEAVEINRQSHIGVLQSEETMRKRRETWARKRADGTNKNGPNSRTRGRQEDIRS